MRTLGQERADFALNKVISLSEEEKAKFKPFSAGAPAMILRNGFGQALAFWISKGKPEHLELLCIIREWLRTKSFAVGQDNTEFMKNITTMEQKEYLVAQKETLALLEWVKLFASAGL